MQKKSNLWSYLAIGFCHLGLGVLFVGCQAKKAVSAEDIVLNYGALEFSVSVDSLETYAKTGKLEGSLASYTRFLTPAQLEKFKTGLVTSIDFSHLAIAQFLYSYQGERILDRVSQVVKTKARQPGFYAIRSALILAAADRENGGLTPLNVLQKFPTKTLRIDSGAGFEIFENLSKVVQSNAKAIAAVEQAALQESQTKPNIAPKVRNLDLLRPGKFRYRKQTLTMDDENRERVFPVELYLPKSKTKESLPLIVISHGLGSDLTTFAYLAKHLASHGFAVAVPEHPGSSARQIESLLTGLDEDVTPPRELIDRPLDIKFLLDRLEADYPDLIDTNNVGMFGQSFGAYTSLALAGAELNWSRLQQDCDNLQSSWNISLLLQCLALQIPEESAYTELKDERIKAAIAINPLTSSIFGKASLSQIEIPITIVSGSADTITPALTEQIVPFTWLESSAKYLVLLKGGTHFSTLNESAGSIPVPEQAIGPDPKIAQTYMRQLSLAFFNSYLQQQEKYLGYLNAEYGLVISKDKMPLSFIESLDPRSLKLK